MAKKKMARGLIVLGGILLGAVSLSGCGNKTSDGKTEVEMISYKPEAVAAFEKIEERFNETHDDIHLTIESPNEAVTILKTRFIREDYPDIVGIGGDMNYSNFLDAGLFEDLSDLDVLKETKQAYLDMEEELKLIPTEGSYALPYAANAAGILYNKDMFEENGWEVPTTIDEFMKICEDASSKGIQPLSVDGVDKFYFTRLWGGYATSKLGTDALVKANAGELSWSDDAFKEAYQWVADLNDKGYMGAGVTTVDSATMNAVFLSGGAAMEYNGSWFASNLNNEEENSLGEDVGFFGFPQVEGAKAEQKDYVQNYGTSWMISNKNYDDALNDWLTYVFSGYGDTSMETQGVLSGFEMKEDHDMPYYTKLVSDMISEAGTACVWPEYKMPSEGMNTSLNNSQMLVLGEMSPEDYGASLDAFYK